MSAGDNSESYAGGEGYGLGEKKREELESLLRALERLTGKRVSATDVSLLPAVAQQAEPPPHGTPEYYVWWEKKVQHDQVEKTAGLLDVNSTGCSSEAAPAIAPIKPRPIADLSPLDRAADIIWGDKFAGARWPLTLTNRKTTTESRLLRDEKGEVLYELVTSDKLPAPESEILLDWALDRFCKAIFAGHEEPPSIPLNVAEIWRFVQPSATPPPSWFYDSVEECFRRASLMHFIEYRTDGKRRSQYAFCDFESWRDGHRNSPGVIIPGGLIWKRLRTRAKEKWVNMRAFPLQALLGARESTFSERDARKEARAACGAPKTSASGGAHLTTRLIKYTTTLFQPPRFERTRPVPLQELMDNLPINATPKKATQMLRIASEKLVQQHYFAEVPEVVAGKGASKQYVFKKAPSPAS